LSKLESILIRRLQSVAVLRAGFSCAGRTFEPSPYWDAYGLAIPTAQHVACEKQRGQISLIERFNCTLRQRFSRLARKSLSFSKSEWFDEEAIRYFIALYNLEKQKLFEHCFCSLPKIRMASDLVI
jgi:hypothetical protein